MVATDDAEVYRKYADELMRFAAALVGPSGAEDLLSTAFLKALRAPSWHMADNKRAYLFRVVFNEGSKVRRDTRRRLERELRVAPRESEDHLDGDCDVVAALLRLSVRQRAVVFLTYWADLPTAEIAALLSSSVRTVERELSAGKQRLVTLNRPSDDGAGAVADVRQVATDLPAGWVLQGALGPGTNERIGFGLGMHAFGTSASPLGPSLAIVTDGFAGMLTDAQSTQTLTLTDGRRAALGDSRMGGRWLDVEIESGKWVGLLARHIGDDALLRLGAAIIVDTSGNAAIDPAQLEQEGLQDFGNVDMASMPYAFSGFISPTAIPVGETLSMYGPDGGDPAVSLASLTPTPALRAGLGVLQVVEPFGDDGDVLVRTNDASSVGMYREADGLAMFASGPSADPDTLVALLNSVSRVSDDEWSRLVRQGEGRARDDQTISTTQSVETTSPPVDNSIGDDEVRFDPIIQQAGSSGTYIASATLSNGAETVTTLAFRGRSLIASVTVDGVAGPTGDVVVAYPNGGGSLTTNPVTGISLILVAVGLDTEAVRVSTTVGGTSFSAPLLQLDDTYPVKISMILVPIPVNGSSQLSEVVLLGPDGSVLGTA